MRVKGVFKPADYPGDPAEIAELFDYLRPGIENPEIDAGHTGIAITAYNPKMAIHLAQLSRFLAVDTGWCQRTDLRELAFQTLNLHFKSEYSFEARRPHAVAAGINDAMMAALPEWRTSSLFDDEQRLVVEYTNAVVTGEVPSELFARVVERFGERGAMECTTVIGFWSAWAMILNAAGA